MTKISILLRIQLFLVFSPFILPGQELRITRSGEEQIFKAGSIYELTYRPGGVSDDSCCGTHFIVGHLRNELPDSLFFVTNEYREAFRKRDRKIERVYYSEFPSYLIGIAKDDIIHFKNYKSLKSRKTKEALIIPGFILTFSTLGTLASGFIVRNDANRNKLFRAAGIQLAAGFTLILARSKKQYKFKKTDDPWSFRN